MGDSTSQTPGALNSVHELGADSASNSDLPPAQIEAKPIEPEPIETISIETKFTWPPKAPAPDAETIGTAEGRAAARDAKSQTRARPLPAVERDRVSLPLDAGPEAPRRSGSNAYRRESDAPIPDTDSSSDASIDLQPSPADTPTSTWSDAIERFERRWLGLIHRSWRTRALAAGWRPDSPDTYCPSCGQDIARYELDTDQRCSACRGSRLAWDAFIRLGHHEALLRDAIHEIKFERSRALALDLGRQLGHAIRARMTAAALENATVAVCPVPTTWRRRMSRGIDHAGLVTAGVRDSLANAQFVRLIRRVHRPSQRDVPPSLRAINVAGAFKRRQDLPPGTGLVVLVDDVRTTGATLSAACRVVRGLIQHSDRGIPVWAAAVAVAGGGGEHSRVG
ncbi:MAG: hypothetical protein JNL50_01165 [Phycisphaerae bacterium]|nr:hypothetical protein [Phycisphaerae bacterium]